MAKDVVALLPIVVMIGFLVTRLVEEHRAHGPRRIGPSTRFPASSPGPAPPAARTKAIEPRDPALDEAMAENTPPTTCPGCGRRRSVLLTWWRWWDGDAIETGVRPACVWCDATSTDTVSAVWCDGHWIVRAPRRTWPSDPAMCDLVRQHLEAIDVERPGLTPPAAAVADLWSHRGRCVDSRLGQSGPAVALILLLAPWLDVEAACHFLSLVAGGDPLLPAPPVVGAAHELDGTARTAVDELALLRAELVGQPETIPPWSYGPFVDTWWTRERGGAEALELVLPDRTTTWLVTNDEIVHEARATDPRAARRAREFLDGRELVSTLRRAAIRRVLLDHDRRTRAPLEHEPRRGGLLNGTPLALWTADEWTVQLALARRARAELAALEYSPEVRRDLLDRIAHEHQVPVVQPWHGGSRGVTTTGCTAEEVRARGTRMERAVLAARDGGLPPR